MDIKLNKKLIRKIGGFALTTTLALSLAACGGKKEETNTQQVEENEIVVEKKKDDKTAKKKDKSKTNEITFSEFLSQDKPVVEYVTDNIFATGNVVGITITKGNKIKILNGDVTSKNMTEFSEMTEDDILSYLGKRMPQKSYDELSDSEKEIVDKFQEKYESKESFQKALGSDLLDKLDSVNLEYNPDIQAMNRKLQDEYSIDFTTQVVEVYRGVVNKLFYSLTDDERVSRDAKDIYNLGNFVDKPTHTVDYQVQYFRELADYWIKEHEENYDAKIDDGVYEAVDYFADEIRKFAEVALVETGIEKDINDILDILYDGDKVYMDIGHDLVYHIKTDSPDNKVLGETGESINYIGRDKKLNSRMLYEKKSPEFETIEDITYIKLPFGYARFPENMNLVNDDVDNKDILVDKTTDEIKEILEAK